MRNRLLFTAVVISLMVLIGCTASRSGLSSITPTPTKTPRPLFTATLTPTATSMSTESPIQPTDTLAPPTETPMPPTETPIQPTDTLVPSTETPAPPTDTPLTPTDTPLPPTDTPAPPTNTPRPQPTNTPAPPTNTPRPQVDFRVQEILAFEDGSLGSTGLHNVYITVLNAGGAPMDGIIVEEVNNQPVTQLVTGNKGPGRTEFTMWAGDYRFKVVGDNNGNTYSSETTHQMSIVFEHAVWDDLIRGGICPDEAACRALGPMHFSYNLTFQRTW